MILEGVGMIACDTSRTRAYLNAMIRHQMHPMYVLILENSETKSLPGQGHRVGWSTLGHQLNRDHNDHCWSELDFAIDAPLRNMLELADIPYSIGPSEDINDPSLVAMISNRPETVFIYSGFGGALLHKKILSIGKRFLHVHGGHLPNYKGSTANYFSLITEGKMGASAIFLSEEIDSGPILLRREFPAPEKREHIDHIFDSAARAKVLIDVLRRFAVTARWDLDAENNRGGETYHVIHPLLKHIAIMGKD